MKTVYFFCYPHGPADRAGYEHQIVCLAEGLRGLGVPFFGNVNYWQEGNVPKDFLIRQTPHVSFRDADIVVFSSVLHRYEATHLLPRDLFNSKRCYLPTDADNTARKQLESSTALEAEDTRRGDTPLSDL